MNGDMNSARPVPIEILSTVLRGVGAARTAPDREAEVMARAGAAESRGCARSMLRPWAAKQGAAIRSLRRLIRLHKENIVK
jgi:hypothetical protein